jgi:hypothetical protein
MCRDARAARRARAQASRRRHRRPGTPSRHHPDLQRLRNSPAKTSSHPTATAPPAPSFTAVLHRVVALTACFIAALTVPAHAAWRLPVHGAVVHRFAYDRGDPFSAGARRGVDLSATPGAAVRAACAGRVTWTGTAPGARGVTVRCGAYVATHLGLGTIAVHRGEAVGAGAVLGRVGSAGAVRLGARRVGDRLGYVDPLGLIGAAGDPVPWRIRPIPSAPASGTRAPAGLSFRSSSSRSSSSSRIGSSVFGDSDATSVTRNAGGGSAGAATGSSGSPWLGSFPDLAWLGIWLLSMGFGVGKVLRRRKAVRAEARAARESVVVRGR